MKDMLKEKSQEMNIRKRKRTLRGDLEGES